MCANFWNSPDTYLLRVHFAVDDPWRSVPGWSVKRSPEVEEENRADSARGKLSIFGWVVGGIGNLDIDGNVPHAEGSSQSTEHEKLGAAEAVNQIQ